MSLLFGPLDLMSSAVSISTSSKCLRVRSQGILEAMEVVLTVGDGGGGACQAHERERERERERVQY